jgi:glycosyltransferase involved in cell wall biosynthesis
MKISVALCTYNGEKYLREQLNSILNQTLKVNEIIVCDDQSTDSTIAILEEYSTKNEGLFKIFKNEINLRSVKNFEKAIKLCAGDIIFLSDQDDSWLPEKVADMICYFELNPNINVVATNGFCMDEHSEIIDKFTVWDIPQLFIDNNVRFDYYTSISYFFNIATGATMALKKSFIKECLPFPIIPNFHHDEWLARVSSSKNQFAFLTKKYIKYRIHDAQQVGGIIYKLNNHNKKELLNLLDLYNYELKFYQFKLKIKRLCTTYYLKKNLNNFDKNYTFHYESLDELKKIVDKYKFEMRKKYPFRSFILNYTDKILNKRQLN